jgi:predicted TIM-barrel fold metal-dependent hydrolase
MAKKPYIIALEEHYQDPEVKQLGPGPGAGRDIIERLDDLSTLRIREMDEAGIDLQVLSHSIPGLQAVDAEAGPPLARRTNDRLYEAVQRHPDRFSAFAVLPTANPRAAADELERAVTKLGFKGAMVNGMTNGVFHDDKRFLADLGAGGQTRRADLYPPRFAARCGHRGLLRGLRAVASRHPACRLGLHG